MSQKSNTPKSYRAAAEELQEIVEELQGDAIDVDHLAERVKRAKFLIEFCQLRLRNTEEEVQSLLQEEEED
ncbi:MAG: exodeoxyribonuclease VII small subunit [Saprospiraceae bacterium]|nr:exodeoxyribonuclease VII small subunit [Saprospiraceae bacterium]